MKILLFAALLLPLPLAAQTAARAGLPVEHRLTPDEIEAAQADGAERNRAAELLAMTRGEPSLLLPGEKPKRQVHGTMEVGIGTNGTREVAGEVTTSLGGDATATVAGSYTQFGRSHRPF